MRPPETLWTMALELSDKDTGGAWEGRETKVLCICCREVSSSVCTSVSSMASLMTEWLSFTAVLTWVLWATPANNSIRGVVRATSMCKLLTRDWRQGHIVGEARRSGIQSQSPVLKKPKSWSLLESILSLSVWELMLVGTAIGRWEQGVVNSGPAWTSQQYSTSKKLEAGKFKPEGSDSVRSDQKLRWHML